MLFDCANLLTYCQKFWKNSLEDKISLISNLKHSLDFSNHHAQSDNFILFKQMYDNSLYLYVNIFLSLTIFLKRNKVANIELACSSITDEFLRTPYELIQFYLLQYFLKDVTNIIGMFKHYRWIFKDIITCVTPFIFLTIFIKRSGKIKLECSNII